ncbi:hypothetical protein [Bacillus infantis]|uniref:hypothetical protein n=1 Tax=Bacillus infantis TaxID=324767 RepID=UPI0021559996|nr:hypothetical protein [Bacillus infantis]MCR6610605.1 hypothetical protein [Bacillus infantis]
MDLPSTTKIWRYMTLSKFIDMIRTHSLFLSRADLFFDKFEGASPELNYFERQKVVEFISRENHGDSPLRIYNGKEWINYGAAKNLNEVFEKIRLTQFVNCWHINEVESEAMWKLYLSGNEGVAITSTFGRLTESLIGGDRVLLEPVRYLDYNSDLIPPDLLEKHGNGAAIFCKRNHYKHEQEVRLVTNKVYTTGVDSEGYKQFDLEKQLAVKGISINVDLSDLIDEIYVSPHSLPYFTEVVSDIIEKYNIKNKSGHLLLPKKSKMGSLPMF